MTRLSVSARKYGPLPCLHTPPNSAGSEGLRHDTLSKSSETTATLASGARAANSQGFQPPLCTPDGAGSTTKGEHVVSEPWTQYKQHVPPVGIAHDGKVERAELSEPMRMQPLSPASLVQPIANEVDMVSPVPGTQLTADAAAGNAHEQRQQKSTAQSAHYIGGYDAMHSNEQLLSAPALAIPIQPHQSPPSYAKPLSSVQGNKGMSHLCAAHQHTQQQIGHTHAPGIGLQHKQVSGDILNVGEEKTGRMEACLNHNDFEADISYDGLKVGTSSPPTLEEHRTTAAVRSRDNVKSRRRSRIVPIYSSQDFERETCSSQQQQVCMQ